jgi:hypothetical protein
MAFKRIKGSDRGMIKRAISSTAFAIGDLVQYSRTGAVVESASATTEVDNIAGVVAEATTTADTYVLLQRIMPGDVYEVGTINNSNAAHNYQRMIWGAAHTANNTGTDVATDTGIFMQTGVIGAVADKKIVGEFTTVYGD